MNDTTVAFYLHTVREHKHVYILHMIKSVINNVPMFNTTFAEMVHSLHGLFQTTLLWKMVQSTHPYKNSHFELLCFPSAATLAECCNTTWTCLQLSTHKVMYNKQINRTVFQPKVCMCELCHLIC